MNRAVRRQQLRNEAKKAGARPSPRSALPRTGPAPRAAARPSARLGFIRVPRFLADIWNELMKVVWPSREDTLHLAVVVSIVTVLFGAALGAIDIGFAWLIDETLLR